VSRNKESKSAAIGGPAIRHKENSTEKENPFLRGENEVLNKKKRRIGTGGENTIERGGEWDITKKQLQETVHGKRQWAKKKKIVKGAGVLHEKGINFSVL